MARDLTRVEFNKKNIYPCFLKYKLANTIPCKITYLTVKSRQKWSIRFGDKFSLEFALMTPKQLVLCDIINSKLSGMRFVLAANGAAPKLERCANSPHDRRLRDTYCGTLHLVPLNLQTSCTLKMGGHLFQLENLWL